LLAITFSYGSYFKLFSQKENVGFQCANIRTCSMLYYCRGFKVFYNRRYFLNFRRYLKNQAEGRKRSRGGGSSWNLAFCGPNNVLQRLQNIKCFWKKNPINEFRFHQEWRPCIMPGFPPQFLYWIFQFTDFSQDYS
jgi:hypothetical protein